MGSCREISSRRTVVEPSLLGEGFIDGSAVDLVGNGLCGNAGMAGESS